MGKCGNGVGTDLDPRAKAQLTKDVTVCDGRMVKLQPAADDGDARAETPDHPISSMTEHPITPPDELVQQWIAQVWHEGTPVRAAASDLHVATQAARWGADQELEACCEVLAQLVRGDRLVEHIRAARRPTSSNLKQQALEALRDATGSDYPHPMTVLNAEQHSLIRRALEALND